MFKKCIGSLDDAVDYFNNNERDYGITYKHPVLGEINIDITPLSAVSINARTLNNNFYDPRVGQDPDLSIWIKYDADYAHLDFDSFQEKDWSSKPSTVNINMDSIIYLVPIMINGNLMIDYHPMVSDSTTISFEEFHLAGGNFGDVGTLIEPTVRKIALETVREQVKDALTDINSGSIDTNFNILEKIDTYFNKLTINLEEIIDDTLKDDRYPNWNEVKTSLNKFDIFNFEN